MWILKTPVGSHPHKRTIALRSSAKIEFDANGVAEVHDENIIKELESSTVYINYTIERKVGE